MPDPIDLITAAPDENNPATIAAQIDLFVQQIKAAIPQLNVAFTALNFLSTNSTSATSLTIGTGTKTIVLAETSRSYVKGMTVKIAKDASNWMLGEVDSYTSGTNTVVVITRLIMGSGTYTDWTISLASTPQDVGNHCVWAHTGNGYGAVATKANRFTTLKMNVGTAITYADDANNGATFTINESGDYEIMVCNRQSVTGRDVFFGVSLNSAALTTNIQGDTAGLMLSYIKDNVIQPVSGVFRLAAGDVIRAHSGQGATYMPDGNGETDSFLMIRKINNG